MYFYEAFILVLASSITGMLIGMLVGVTMILQEALLLDRTIKLFFPWTQFLIILGASIICAFFATFSPVYQLTRKEIAQIFRLV